MESSTETTEPDASADAEAETPAEDAVRTIIDVQIWLHVGSRRRRKTQPVATALSERIKALLSKEGIETKHIEIVTIKSHCSRLHRHSEVIFAFQTEAEAEQVEELLAKIEPITIEMREKYMQIKAARPKVAYIHMLPPIDLRDLMLLAGLLGSESSKPTDVNSDGSA